MGRTTLSATVLLLLFFSSTYCQKIFPDPTETPRECGRNVKSWVCDPYNYLTSKTAEKIDDIVTRIAENTTTSCGEPYIVSIAIVSTMRTYNYGSSLSEAKRFAKDIHDSWGVGFAHCQTGVVVFLALTDRHMYISTGAETKKILTDELAETVINRMKPYLKKANYDDALIQCIEDIHEILNGRDLQTSWSDLFSMFLGFIFVIVIIFIIFASYLNSKKWNKCKTELSKIEKEKAEMLSKRYKQKHCPICLTDFPASELEKDEENSDSSSSSDDEETDLVKEVRKRKVHETPEIPITDDQNSDIQLLRCGHKFCKSCIQEWLAKNDHCPICRMKTSGDEDGGNEGRKEDTTWTSRSRSNYRNYQRVNRFDLLSYELLMLRSRYPTYIRQDMVDRWSQPSFTGRMTEDQAFTATQPSSSSGGRKSGSSFGGGSSGGGGGAGGSW